MAELTWLKREMPILEAVFELEERSGDDGFITTTVEQIADATGLDLGEVRRGVRALYESGYIVGENTTVHVGYNLYGIRLLEKGRQRVGQWPGQDSYESLITFLEDSINSEEDPDRKSKLERLKDGVTSVGRDVAGSVLSAWFRHMAGL
ncbi:MAG TPA: hypothetical protein VEV82_01220 [Actinomycetota bacterium]|nr:hypothetical protein [Actinomycetota bacterium]